MKKVYKYGTGHPVPDGAIYLNTLAETKNVPDNINGGFWVENVLVWHYFLVDVAE